MNGLNEVDEIIIKKLIDLPNDEKKEVLNFIEFMQIKQDRLFIEYVNERSKKAVKDMEKGEKIISLKELQAEYGKKI
ncbi:hypothetical protein ACFLZM_04210 [Thermodesulfobacteriota bacterium]